MQHAWCPASSAMLAMSDHGVSCMHAMVLQGSCCSAVDVVAAKDKCIHPTRPIKDACPDCPRKKGRGVVAEAEAPPCNRAMEVRHSAGGSAAATQQAVANCSQHLLPELSQALIYITGTHAHQTVYNVALACMCRSLLPRTSASTPPAPSRTPAPTARARRARAWWLLRLRQ
jgi:hypothetical protein